MEAKLDEAKQTAAKEAAAIRKQVKIALCYTFTLISVGYNTARRVSKEKGNSQRKF